MFSNIINEIENKSSLYSDIDMKIVNFIKMIEQKNKGGELPTPTPLRVSTRSAKCTINSQLILELLGSTFYNNIYNNIVMKKDPSYLIKGISMKDMVLNTVKKKGRRKNKKKDTTKVKKKSKSKEHFYNQCSIIIKPDQDRRPVNIKLFLNGSVSMTGCLENKDGYDAMCVLMKELKKYPNIFVNHDDVNNIAFNNYQITMINSDYSINFKIDRLKLYNLLRNETDIFVTYEPENYPGVKINFYCNSNKKYQDGICKCVCKKCKGKGMGHGEGECKKITVAIFQSGSIIITGARAFEQTKIAYNFINKFLLENYTYIIKFSIIDYIDESSDENEDDEDNQIKNKKIIKIKNKKKLFNIQPDKVT